MLYLLKKNYDFYFLFLPVFIGSSYIVTSAPLLIGTLGLIWFTIRGRYDYIVFTFILTLILANNKAPEFESYENLRVIIIGAMMLLSIPIVFREKGIDRRILYFIPFFLIALVSSILFSPLLTNSLFKIISYLLLVLSVFIFVKYVIKIEHYRFYDNLLLLILITMVISLIGRFLDPSAYVIAGRLNGVMGNPNFLALYCILAYPFVDHYQIKNSSITANGLLVLKGLIVLCLFLSGSRNGYTSFAIYLILTVFLFRGVSGKTVALFLVLGAFVAFIQIRALVELIPFLGDFLRPDSLETASGRSVVWAVAVDEILRQPWLGGGFEYYHYFINSFRLRYGLEGVFWHGIWNSYLAILLDVGLVGLTAYGFFMYGLIKECPGIKILLPFLAIIAFSAIFEGWMVSSLNPITPLFILFFLVIAEYGSRYENTSIA